MTVGVPPKQDGDFFIENKIKYHGISVGPSGQPPQHPWEYVHLKVAIFNEALVFNNGNKTIKNGSLVVAAFQTDGGHETPAHANHEYGEDAWDLTKMLLPVIREFKESDVDFDPNEVATVAQDLRLTDEEKQLKIRALLHKTKPGTYIIGEAIQQGDEDSMFRMKIITDY